SAERIKYNATGGQEGLELRCLYLKPGRGCTPRLMTHLFGATLHQHHEIAYFKSPRYEQPQVLSLLSLFAHWGLYRSLCDHCSRFSVCQISFPSSLSEQNSGRW